MLVEANAQGTLGDSIGSLNRATYALYIDFNAFDALGIGLLDGTVIVGASAAQLTLDKPVTNPAPEPGTLALFGLGAVTFGVARRRVRQAPAFLRACSHPGTAADRAVGGPGA